MERCRWKPLLLPRVEKLDFVYLSLFAVFLRLNLLDALCLTVSRRRIPGLLLQYRNDLHWGRFDQAMEHMETMAALSLSVVLRECKQMGTALTVEQGVRFLESHILPHQNRSILKNRADEIAMQFQSVLAKNNRQGIRTQAEKKEVASAWLELAISCAKVPVKYEADEIKRRQKEEKTQRETEPVMA